jgi:5-methylcytosine-specific restriction endonuclease McrA
MKCLCKICGVEFDANPMWKHAVGLCGDVCRKAQKAIVRAKYKASEKGRAAEMRWRKNPAKKEIDKRSCQTKAAKAKAVIRSRRTMANNPHLQEQKRERDKVFGKTDRGREINKAARQRYSKTIHGKLRRASDKARRRGAVGSFTPEEWNAKMLAHGGACVQCGSTSHIEIDHIIPISKGGTNNIENLQPLCRSCNASKGNR